MKKRIFLAFLLVILLTTVGSNLITAKADEWSNAEDFYNQYLHKGAYNADDNRIYFATADTVGAYGQGYVTVGKRIYFNEYETGKYIEFSRFDSSYVQEYGTMNSGNQEYLLYSIDLNTVINLFNIKYGYIPELNENVNLYFFVDDLMSFWSGSRGNRLGSVAENGDGTVNCEGNVYSSAQDMRKGYATFSGNRLDFSSYYRVEIDLTKGKKQNVIVDTVSTEDWTNYAHYIYPDAEDVPGAEYWSEDSFWAEAEGIHTYTFYGYRTEHHSDPIPGSYGPSGYDALGNQKYDYDYEDWDEEVLCGSSTIEYKIDYKAPIIYNVNDSYGWINYTLFLNPATRDEPTTPDIACSGIKNIEIVGGAVEGVSNLTNNNQNKASFYFTYRNEGTHILTVRATDYAGNIALFEITVYQDFTPPYYYDYDSEVLGPTKDGWLWSCCTKTDFYEHATDDLSGLNYMALYNEGCVLQNIPYQLDSITHTDPAYIEKTLVRPYDWYIQWWTYVAVDNAGNRCVKKITTDVAMGLRSRRAIPSENYK